MAENPATNTLFLQRIGDPVSLVLNPSDGGHSTIAYEHLFYLLLRFQNTICKLMDCVTSSMCVCLSVCLPVFQVPGLLPVLKSTGNLQTECMPAMRTLCCMVPVLHSFTAPLSGSFPQANSLQQHPIHPVHPMDWTTSASKMLECIALSHGTHCHVCKTLIVVMIFATVCMEHCAAWLALSKAHKVLRQKRTKCSSHITSALTKH